LKIDQWAAAQSNIYTADVALSAGAHEIRFEFAEYTGDAGAHLTWFNPNCLPNAPLIGAAPRTATSAVSEAPKRCGQKIPTEQEKPVMTTLRAISFRARSWALTCALFVALPPVRFARRLRAVRHRPRPVGARFAYSGFRRFACLLMVAVMFVQFALFPPEVSHATVKAVSATAVNSAQDARHWWHASGWAAWSERFLQRIRDGKGAQQRAVPKPEPQETQEERNGRVTRVEISPREATIAASQEIYFIAVAYDANN